MNVAVKRIYEGTARDDGFRILVDRVWPRGLSREDANIDLWDKNIAPSTELRKWFAHDPAKWEEFKRKYHEELDGMPDAVRDLKKLISGHKHATLLYSAHDTEHNQAQALLEYLGK